MSDLPKSFLENLAESRFPETLRKRKPWSFKNYQESLRRELNSGEEIELYSRNNPLTDPELNFVDDLVDQAIEEEELIDDLVDLLPDSDVATFGTKAGVSAAAASGSSSVIPAVAVGTGAATIAGAILGATLSSNKDNKENHQSPHITLPGHKYLGPGNSINTGVHPVDEDDLDAFNHDIDYSKSKTPEEVRKADREHILNTLDKAKSGDIHSIISNLGIGTKYAVESISGVKYPYSFSGE